MSEIDRAALRRATLSGWLELTADLSDAALAVWQRQCLISRRPFVVIRPEANRSTLWLALTPGCGWTAREREMVAGVLGDARGAAVHSMGVRAFLPRGAEQTIATKLIALALAASPIEQASWAEESGDPIN
jgi:hypothetical protein